LTPEERAANESEETLEDYMAEWESSRESPLGWRMARGLAENMETWHGATPQLTNDAAEAGNPQTYDIAYGHKIKDREWESKHIYGVRFIDDNGNRVPISKADGMKILNKDAQTNLRIARTARRGGWDAKLRDKWGATWEDLEPEYQRALTSLAYNVGGAKAARLWDKVLKAALDKDVVRFAKELRRQDNERYTAGMDNRVAKEMYYSGLIKKLSTVEDVLPLANARQAGIPS